VLHYVYSRLGNSLLVAITTRPSFYNIIRSAMEDPTTTRSPVIFFHFNALLKLKIRLICVIDCCFFEASSDCLHKFFASGVSIRLQGRLRPCRTNGRISACYRHRTFLVPYPPAYSWCPGDVISFSSPFLYGSSRKTNKPSSCCILFFK
jgi:hypothetical protein